MTTTAAPIETTRAAIRPLHILAWGAALGGAGDVLFKGAHDLGPNIVIMVGLLALAAWHQARGAGIALPDRWLLTALGFAFCLMWRDSPMLRGFDLLAMIAALSLTSLAQRVTPWRGLLRDYAVTAGRTIVHAAGGTLILLTDDGALRKVDARKLGKITPVLVGLVLAVPVVLVFAGLFANADPMFEGFVVWLTTWNLGPIVTHVAIIAAIAWISAGLLRAWLTEPAERFEPDSPPRVIINPLTVGIVVGSMTAMFVLFVASQSRQLFGGAALIEATAGLTYAEHARRGFFEMVAASGLAIPVLLVANTALAGASAAARFNFRALGRVQLILIALVMASALHRVGLYISMYGLTVDRFAGMAMLVWLGIVVGWFAVTVLGGRPERFTFGAAVSGFAVLGALNAVNPEAIIARVNTRATAARTVDYAYLLTLSGDAVPAIAESLRDRPAGQHCDVNSRLRQRWLGTSQDWRSWNRGRAEAVRAIASLRC